MALKYLQLPVNFGALFENLEDAEIGMLIRAMLMLCETGEEPDFSPGHRTHDFWPMCRRAVTDSIDGYEEQCKKNRENGKKGGRPKKQIIGKPVLVEKDPELNSLL